jgi:hypothetical protein
MQKNQKTILILAIGGVLLICCVVAVIGALVIVPMWRARSATSIYGQSQPLPPGSIEPLNPTIAPTIGEIPEIQLPSQGAAVTESPAATEAPPQVVYNGVSFFLAPEVAQGTTPSDVPAVTGDPANSFPGDIHPAYIQFAFDGYPLSGTFHEPQILIYPAQEYGAIDPSVAQIVIRLQQVLQNKPTDVDSLPFLPIWNAGQFMQANIEYLDFQNGSGVRFLTQYGQAAWPVNNTDLFYTFQGLTGDGKWYVSAIFPVSHPSLPQDGNGIQDSDPGAFAQNFPNYLAQIETQLSSLPGDSFTPSLLSLDALVGSLEVK